MQLEANPTQNQEELKAKKQQLSELQTKQKELTKFLPLNTQISLLEKEIKKLENKPTKTMTEERVLESKKKELEELLRKQGDANTNETKPSSDKTGLCVGLGIIGILLVLGIFIIARIHKKKK